ncbi:hypothetical protein FWK35_00003387 [Aphis craccivora]|uniref:Uncharacterized protein n=1 Tax=Aphis craccivora TaxID=307492 RepID=A0A6G0ZML8_APHCR|nr:hypothetical protein FWK35_00003387 [Aphis craccivora]
MKPTGCVSECSSNRKGTQLKKSLRKQYEYVTRHCFARRYSSNRFEG